MENIHKSWLKKAATGLLTLIALTSFSGKAATFDANTLVVTDAFKHLVSYSGGLCVNQFIRGLSIAGVPTCATVNLTSDITGALSAANGGTGITSIGSAGQILRSTGAAFALSTTIWPNTATSGGVLYSSAANTWATSGALGSTQVVLGGGAGAAPNTSTNLTFNGSTLALTGAQTISGNLTVDTATLFVDSTNDRVGIGTTVPRSLAHFSKDGTTASTALFSGAEFLSGTNNGNAFARFHAASAVATERPAFVLQRSRGTIAVPTTIVNQDAIGNFTFNGFDGTSRVTAALLDIYADGTISAGVVPGAFGFWTTDSTGVLQLRQRIAGSGFTAFGSHTPTAIVHIKAGTTTANTAPLKLNSGALNTTAEVGATEFLTDKIYFTITTGAARKEITLNDAALTSGIIPIATTNGRITNGPTPVADGVRTFDCVTVGNVATMTITKGLITAVTLC